MTSGGASSRWWPSPLLGLAPRARRQRPRRRLPTHPIAPSATDPAIDADARRTMSGSRLNRSGGSGSCSCSCRRRRDQPPDGVRASSATRRGRLGYHTIILAYRNEAPVAALPPRGRMRERARSHRSPPNCAIDARTEILNGSRIDRRQRRRADSIENRLNKLLVHLARDLPRRRLVAVHRRQRSGRRRSGRRP